MKLKSALGLLAALGLTTQAQATVVVPVLTQDLAAAKEAGLLNLVDWKVGTTMDYQVRMMFGQGSMRREVVKDEGTAIWVNQDMSIMGQKQKTEMLIRKEDAKVLKLLVNGQEQQIPDASMEIIEQKYVNVTVPAGTFDCLYVLAKSKESSKIQIWVNPQATTMDGMLKMTQASQFGEISLSLSAFRHIP